MQHTYIRIQYLPPNNYETTSTKVLEISWEMIFLFFCQHN